MGQMAIFSRVKWPSPMGQVATLRVEDVYRGLRSLDPPRNGVSPRGVLHHEEGGKYPASSGNELAPLHYMMLLRFAYGSCGRFMDHFLPARALGSRGNTG
jgi:hypothetical protein